MGRYATGYSIRRLGPFNTTGCQCIVSDYFVRGACDKHGCHAGSLVDESESLEPVIKIGLSTGELVDLILSC
jgi:hypothetical protein